MGELFAKHIVLHVHMMESSWSGSHLWQILLKLVAAVGTLLLQKCPTTPFFPYVPLFLSGGFSTFSV